MTIKCSAQQPSTAEKQFYANAVDFEQRKDLAQLCLCMVSAVSAVTGGLAVWQALPKGYNTVEIVSWAFAIAGSTLAAAYAGLGGYSEPLNQFFKNFEEAYPQYPAQQRHEIAEEFIRKKLQPKAGCANSASP